MRNAIILTFFALPWKLIVGVKSHLRGSRQTSEQSTFRITWFDELVRQEDGSFASIKELVAIPINEGSETAEFFDIDLPDDILTDNFDLIASGTLFVSSSSAFVVDGETLRFENEADISIQDKSPSSERRLAENHVRRVAVLRVSLSDGPEEKRQVSYSASQIHQHLFENDVSLKKQMEHCSNGGLVIESAGMYEITVPGQASDYSSPAQLRNRALDALATQEQVPAANSLADHVIVILPPNDFAGFIG